MTAADDAYYGDLLGLWADLESALSLLLAHPAQIQQFRLKLDQLCDWLDSLIAEDADAALYLMFQLAAGSSTGYSAAHALVCATLAEIVGRDLQLPAQERQALVRAALTMNIGMTGLQDALARQSQPLSAAQQKAVREHPAASRRLLERIGIAEPLWLDAVALHHLTTPSPAALRSLAPAERLARLLATTDRYAAMLSPRQTRAGRNAAESANAVTGPSSPSAEAGAALVRCVGLFPPGLFVRLSSGETAVVLRRSQPGEQVACVLDARGQPLRQPELVHIAGGQRQIQHALAQAEVGLQVNQRSMVRLGLYAAQFSAGLRQVATMPGSSVKRS